MDPPLDGVALVVEDEDDGLDTGTHQSRKFLGCHLPVNDLSLTLDQKDGTPHKLPSPMKRIVLRSAETS